MHLSALARGRLVAALTLVAVALPSPASPFTIDRDGDAKIGLRAYTAVRVGTEAFDTGTRAVATHFVNGVRRRERFAFGDGSFPRTGAGNLRQHRFFLEIELNHKLTRLMETTNGPVGLFRRLPFSVDRLGYNLTYRGEGEGIYDWGPEGFTTFEDYKTVVGPLEPPLGPTPEQVRAFGREHRRRIKRVGRSRHRLYQAYVDFESGPAFLRVGRQNLSWGETDNFRLLDNINPLDNGFGGFFVDIDERRIPLDMLRANLALPDWGPFSQAFFEGFGALGNRIAYQPGIPVGSPWQPGGLNAPNTNLRTVRTTPDAGDLRGGGRFVFNVRDITFSIAHYWTYLDIPAVKLRVPPGLTGIENRVQAIQEAPKVPISGASMTFAVPRFYTIVRSEFAYFQDEAANCQGIGTPDQAVQPAGSEDPRLRRNLNGCIDPFLFPNYLFSTEPIIGKIAKRDSINWSIGFDINRYIRWLNPGQTILISTQFFYKHIVDAFDDQVLPVPVRTVPVNLKTGPLAGIIGDLPLERRLATVPQDQFLHTLRIQTSYRGGTVQPQLTVFYDWVGVWRSVPPHAGVHGHRGRPRRSGRPAPGSRQRPHAARGSILSSTVLDGRRPAPRREDAARGGRHATDRRRRCRSWPAATRSLPAVALALLAATAHADDVVAPGDIRQNLFSLCVASDRVAWAVGELGRVFRTADGGASWTRQDAGTKKTFLAASCIDERTAWIGGKNAMLQRTTDAGATWTLLTPNTTKHVFDLRFTSPRHGVAAGDWGLLMYTEDGGDRWTLVGMPEEFVLSPLAEDIGLEPGDTILYALSFPDPTRGWAVGEFGTILATADGGRTWRQQRSPVDSTLFGTHFADAERGWAVGLDGVILHTTDGGSTWRQAPSPVSQRSLYDVALSGRHGWIAGDSGTLLKSGDGGQTWQIEPLPIELAANWFRTVRLLPGSRGLIAGSEGLLFAVEGDRTRALRSDATRPAPRGPS
jgi:photosystem II stability/assembly factor-like uncharacterized protein